MIQNYLTQAELALAAYATLTTTRPDEDALKAEGMPPAQAAAFAAKWSVVTQYTDTGTGLSATVFQEVATGKRYLAIRGTEPSDFLRDVIINDGLIAVGYIPDSLPQYRALKDQVAVWLGNGTLPSSFTVSGHSLGGYLATALTADFAANITQTYLFNAPGLNGVLGNATAAILEAFGITAPVDASKIFNLKAEHGFSPIAGLGAQVAPTISIHIEDQSFSDVVDPPLSFNHSQRVLTDSLALYALFARIDPDASVESISKIIKAASAQNGNTLELTLDALRTLFQQNYHYGHLDYDAVPTLDSGTAASRDDYYANLQSLTAWWDASPFTALTIEPLSTLSREQIVAKARLDTAEGQAYRYALYKLNPFAVTGSSVLYDGINAHGELDLYAPASGTGALTERYLRDRAAMLTWQNQFNTDDTQPENGTFYKFQGGTPYYFRDMTTDTRINVGGGLRLDFAMARPENDYSYIVFGSENDGPMFGQGKSDWLYGGAGADTLTGKGGNDYLEGGAGFDTYVINAGDGYDTLLDTDGLGVINLGGVLAKGGATAGLDPAKWRQSGNVWQDQQNGLTYQLVVQGDGSQKLFITGLEGSTVEVRGWSEGELGIVLGTGAQQSVVAAPATNLTIAGDLKPLDTDPAADGVQEDYDALDNLLVTGVADPGREDTLYDSVGNDHLLGLGGNDAIYAWRGGDDLIEGGSGQDYLSGGAGNDTLVGGNDSDVLMGGAGSDHLFAQDQTSDLAAAILASETQPGTGARGDWLSGDAGSDTLVGGAGNDVLLGGEGEDLLIGGGGNDNIYGDQHGDANIDWVLTRTITEVDSSITYHTGITDGTTMEAAVGAADVIYGGAGDDWIEGGQGNDFIDAGADNDVVFGGAGSDVILGGSGNDLLIGNAGFQTPHDDGGDFIDGGAGDDEIWGGGGNDILLGGDGDDVIYGDGNGAFPEDDGDDYIDGGSGNDRLFGGGGNDTLDGGAGLDYLEGGAGDDTYVNVTGGDTIYDIEGNNTIILATANGLGAGGLSTSVQMDGDGNSYLQLAIELDDGSSLKLDTPFFADGINTIQFADGNVLDLETLVGEQLTTGIGLQNGDDGGRLYGGAGDDTLIGGAGADVLSGHLGNDIMQGGAGDDTYLGVAGGDSIFDIEGNNTIVLEAQGLSAGGLATSVQTNADGTQYIELTVALDTGGVLKLDSPFFADGVTTLQFAGGATLDLETLVSTSLVTPLALQLGDNGGRVYGGAGADLLLGGVGDDTLVGYGGNDTLQGGGGDDVLIGGAGNDHYVFTGGRDTVVEDMTSIGSNTLAINAALADLSVTLHTETDGSQTLRLSLPDGSGVDIRNGFLGAISSITLDGGATLSLHNLLNSRATQGMVINGTAASDRLFGGAGDDVLEGLAGNDILDGGDGNDILNGGSGADILIGGAGNDIYVLDSISGSDYIDDGQGMNLIRFAGEITPENLTIVSGGAALLLRAGGQEVARIIGGLHAFRFEFENGPQMSATEFLAAYGADPIWSSGDDGDDVLRGGAGNDQLYGGEGNDDLAGGKGDDLLYGGLGSDIYRYNLGDGQDVIEEYGDLSQGHTSQDRVVFGAGITAADVTFRHLTNGDLSVQVGAQENALIVKDWYSDAKRRVEIFEFADGGTVEVAALILLAVEPTLGTAGNDTMLGVADVDVLMGLSGDDLLIGNGGADDLHGGTGTDTYRWAPGNSGADRVFEEADETSFIELYGQDLSRLGGARIGDDLVLSVAGSVETMTLKDYYTQNHDWQVKDALGTVRGLDDLLADNATRNASLSELDRLREAYVGGIHDIVTKDFSSHGLTPLADGSWQTFPSFMVSRGVWDYERLPGWSGHVPADSSWYAFSNASWYSTGRFDLSVYSSDAAEITPADFLSPPSWSWQQVLSKVEVMWDSQSQSDPQQTVNVVAGGYQYSASEWTSILNNALLPLGLSIYDFNFNGIDIRNVSMNGLSNPYTSTTTPAYTYQYTTTDLVGTVLSTEPSDGTGYSIDGVLAVDFFNLAILPTTLNVLLSVSNRDRQLQVIEGGDGDNLIDVSELNAGVIVHAGGGDDIINGRSSWQVGPRFHPSYFEHDAMFLDGGAGDDLIEGGAGADLIIGGVGNDTLKGGDGQDRYFFFAGQTGTDLVIDDVGNSPSLLFGSTFPSWWSFLENGTWSLVFSGEEDFPRAHDFMDIEMVNAYSTEVDWAALFDYGGVSPVIPPDTVEFGEGVVLSDLSFSWGTEAVEMGPFAWANALRWRQTLDVTWQPGAVARFVLPNPDDVHGSGVELFKFSDGTELTIGQMVALAGGYRGLIEGTHGNDSLIGTSATDWIFGFAGNDILHGGDGRDFLFSGGDDSSLYGDAGNDVLSGSYGNDWLDGGDGDDSMAGGMGDDVYIVDSASDTIFENPDSGTDTVQSSVTFTLAANVENLTLTGTAAINGTGNDLANILTGNSSANILTGGEGNDTYIFGKGSGQDTVNSYDTTVGKLDTVQFDESVDPSEVLVSRIGNDLVLSINGTTDTLTILNYLENDGITPYSVEQIRFYDETTWDLETVVALLSTTATATIAVDPITADDTINAVEASTIIAVTGSVGGDAGQGDTVSFTLNGTDYSGSVDADGNFSIDVAGMDLASETSFEVTVEGTDVAGNPFSASTTSTHTVDTTATATIAVDPITADDMIDAVEASAILAVTGSVGGDAGQGDTVSFTLNGTDYSGSVDAAGNFSIDVAGMDLASETSFEVTVEGTDDAGNLFSASTTSTHTVSPNIGNQTPELAVALHDQATNVGDVFSFTVDPSAFTDPDTGDTLTYSATLADGSPLPSWLSFDAQTRTFSGMPAVPGTLSVLVTATDPGNLTATDVFIISIASAAPVTLNGTSGSNTLNGGAGHDTLNGLAGDDILNGNAGDDILNGGAGNDTMSGGDGDDLFLVEGDSGSDTVNGGAGFDEIRGSAGDDIIRFANYSGENTVERIDGGGGYNRIVSGTWFGNMDFSTTELVNIDRIEGNAGDNQITGNEDNNVIVGAGGADRLWGLGGDDLFLVEGDSGSDTVNGGEGFDEIRGSDGDDNIRFASYSGENTVERIDGGGGYNRIVSGTWFGNMDFSTTELVNIDRIEGGAGNDKITGNQDNNVIVGGAGNDTLSGGDGDDLFLVEGESGSDTVNGGAGFDEIRGSDGDDIFRFANYTGENTVERIDGSGGYNRIVSGTWFGNMDFSTTELVNIDRIEGSAGDNQITGSAGDDVLWGAGGSDQLTGGLGNDTYILGRGDGKDTIVENDTTVGNTDVAQFGSGITVDQLWFRQSSNNLEVSIIGTSDKLVIKDWYLGDAYRVEEIKTTDGAMTLIDNNVQNLVNAMASFAPPAAGQTTLPQNYQDALGGVIAANWQ